MSRDKRIKKILAYVLLLVLAFTNIGFGREPISVYAATKYVVIYFVDNTTEQWVGNDAAVMELVDNTNGHDSYWMTQKDDVTWCVTVPESACNITFNRYSSDKSTKWNSWSAGGRDENNAYYADGAEYGHWDVVEEGENYFHAGDIIYLDLSEFLDWEKDDALMYINFSDASKEENGGNDISISNADKSLYEPQKVSDKVDEYVYQYIFTEDSEGAVNLRFWRGNSDTLWNYSLVLSYEEYLDGINCIKVKDWDNAGVILAHNIEIDIEKDSDNDGLSDDYEDKIGTNKAKKDTDNDGLSDYIEVSLGYSPVLSDTDDDGIIDGEEDFEGDGLTNKEEVNIGTDISWWDTDDDGLDDYDEINNYYTLPLMEDTDSDGIVDGIEVKFGLNPLEKDGNGDGIEDALEKITYLFDAKLMIDDYDKNVYPQVELSGDIKTLDSFEISIKENNYIIN